MSEFREQKQDRHRWKTSGREVERKREKDRKQAVCKNSARHNDAIEKTDSLRSNMRAKAQGHLNMHHSWASIPSPIHVVHVV